MSFSGVHSPSRNWLSRIIKNSIVERSVPLFVRRISWWRSFFDRCRSHRHSRWYATAVQSFTSTPITMSTA